MHGGETVLSVAEAAAQLGVSPTEVRRLVHAGTLVAERVGVVLLVDESSVHVRARLAQGVGGRGRALAPSNAWAVLWEVSGQRADWLTGPQRSRLRSWLTSNSPERIAHACRTRAERFALRVLPVYRDRLLAEPGILLGGWSAAADFGADVTSLAQQPDEFYCSAATLHRLRGELGLSERGVPNLIVRVPRLTGDKAAPRELLAAFDQLLAAATPGHSSPSRSIGLPLGPVAVDLSESDDVRTRRAGLALLERGLDKMTR